MSTMKVTIQSLLKELDTLSDYIDTPDLRIISNICDIFSSENNKTLLENFYTNSNNVIFHASNVCCFNVLKHTLGHTISRGINLGS